MGSEDAGHSPLPLAGAVASRTTVDYTKLRQDLTRAVGRLCPRWLANERDDLVQTAVVRVYARHGRGAGR